MKISHFTENWESPPCSQGQNGQNKGCCAGQKGRWHPLECQVFQDVNVRWGDLPNPYSLVTPIRFMKLIGKLWNKILFLWLKWSSMFYKLFMQSIYQQFIIQLAHLSHFTKKPFFQNINFHAFYLQKVWLRIPEWGIFDKIIP